MAFLPLVAAGLSAGSSLLGGISKAESAGYQGQIASNNALTAARNANYSAAAGSAQTEQAGLKARAELGNVRAGLAANNLNVNTGSAADVQTSQREVGDLDTATVASRAAEAVYGYRVQGSDFRAQAAADRAQIGPDIAGGILSAGGSLAGSAPNIPGAMNWLSKGAGSPASDSADSWLSSEVSDVP